MTEFGNPYAEPREKSPGELAIEYSELFKMASLLFGLSFTDREKAAIPVVVSAIMREKSKVDLERITSLLKMFAPK